MVLWAFQNNKNHGIVSRNEPGTGMRKMGHKWVRNGVAANQIEHKGKT